MARVLSRVRRPAATAALRCAPLDLLATLVAAAAHDHGHPGVSNGYLARTGHPLALVYNDRAPLESFHASSVFHLMRDPRLAILRRNDDPEHLPGWHMDFGADRSDLTSRPVTPQEWQRFRHSVVELILSTDLSMHLDIVGRFNALDLPDLPTDASLHSPSIRSVPSSQNPPVSSLHLPKSSSSFKGGTSTSKPYILGGGSTSKPKDDSTSKSKDDSTSKPKDGSTSKSKDDSASKSKDDSTSKKSTNGRVLPPSSSSSSSSSAESIAPPSLESELARPITDEDRSTSLLARCVALKCADIGHAGKPPALHRRWACRIVEEMWREGDKARREGVEVSQVFDRSNRELLPRSQAGFLRVIAAPLFGAWEEFSGDASLRKQVEANVRLWDAMSLSQRSVPQRLIDSVCPPPKGTAAKRAARRRMQRVKRQSSAAASTKSALRRVHSHVAPGIVDLDPSEHSSNPSKIRRSSTIRSSTDSAPTDSHNTVSFAPDPHTTTTNTNNNDPRIRTVRSFHPGPTSSKHDETDNGSAGPPQVTAQSSDSTDVPPRVRQTLEVALRPHGSHFAQTVLTDMAMPSPADVDDEDSDEGWSDPEFDAFERRGRPPPPALHGRRKDTAKPVSKPHYYYPPLVPTTPNSPEDFSRAVPAKRSRHSVQWGDIVTSDSQRAPDTERARSATSVDNATGVVVGTTWRQNTDSLSTDAPKTSPAKDSAFFH